MNNSNNAQSYYENRVRDISLTLEKQPKDALNYIFISDIHYMGIPTGQGEVLLNQMKLVAETAKRDKNIDLVVLGGDTLQGYWADKTDHLSALTEILSPLSNCKKPVLILIGNHDDNAYAAWNENFSRKIMSDLDWKQTVLTPFAVKDRVHPSDDPNSKHYYCDFLKNGKTIRIFCLDAIDNDMEYDENGVVTKLYLAKGETEKTPEGSYKYKTGMSTWGYSGTQIKWLAENLCDTNAFDDVIIFSHMGIDAQTNTNPINFGDELRAVIKAYNNKTEYKNDKLGINVNYTDSGKILVYHYGHIHRENKLYSDDIKLWQIASSTARADQVNPAEKREIGTDSEACIDVVSVSSNGIRKFNIGGGTDYNLNT